MRCSDFYTTNKVLQSGVCQLENIVIHKDRQKLMIYVYSILSNIPYCNIFYNA